MIQVSFETVGTLGDWLCMVSASREYARRHPGEEVFVTNLGDVIDAYGDGLLKCGRCRDHRQIHPVHREKHRSTRHNYLGTFLRELCPEITEPMNLELPRFTTTEDRIAVIQPYSSYAENPSREYIQALVSTFIKGTGRKIYAVGNLQTRQDLSGVDYSLLQDSAPLLLEHVAQADVVLSPRSATAHAAAGYCIPSFVWVPDDGENWHLNYPGWHHRCHYHKEGPDSALASLSEFLNNLGMLRDRE